MENLISRLRGLSNFGDGEQSGRWIALTELGPSLCDLLKDIFAGRVRIFEAEGQGLAAFRFSADDVRRIRLAKRQADRGYTRKEAAWELGIPLVLLRKAIDSGLMTPTVEGGNGQLISRTDLEAFMGDYVDFHQALQLLGVAQVTLKRWLRKGVLVPLLSTDRRFRKHLFRRADVIAFRGNPVDSVGVHRTDAVVTIKQQTGMKPQAALLQQAELKPDALVSWAQACTFLKVSPAWLGKRIREGKILPVAGPKTNGDKALTFQFGDVALLGETWPRRRPTCRVRALAGTRIRILPKSQVNRNHLLSVAEAAGLLGVTQKHLRGMVYNGTIPVVLQEWPSGYMYFDKVTIEGRVSRHLSVTSSEAANILGIPVHVLDRWRKRGRIKPIEGPNINGVGRYRYRRADVEALMIEMSPDEQTFPGD